MVFPKNPSRKFLQGLIAKGDRNEAALLAERAECVARIAAIDKQRRKWRDTERTPAIKKKRRMMKKRRKAVTSSRMTVVKYMLEKTPGLTIEAILAKLKKAGHTPNTKKPIQSIYNQINAKGSGISRKAGRYFLTKAKGKKRDGGQEG